MPAASLGHYALLSLVAIGSRRNWELGLRISDFGFVGKNADLTKEHASIPLFQWPLLALELA